MRNVALCYVRKSMVRTATDAVSPERQRANCAAEAARRGYRAEFYEDAEGHKSGRSEKGRAGWLALKDQLPRDDIAAVIVESLSRASRSVKDLAYIVEELQARGVALISLKEQIDTASAMGRAFIGIIAVINQFESDIASERMKMTITFKRESKGQHFGYTPFGCERDLTDGALRPAREGVWRIGDACVVGLRDEPPFADEARAAQLWRGYHDALTRCFEWYAEGDAGNVALRDRLNAAGYCYRDRHGNPRAFDENDVRRMLAAQRVYAGFVLNGRAKMGAGVLREANFAPIVPRELCDRVQATQATRRKYGAQFIAHRKGRLYLLGDLLYCGACGQKMGGMFQDGKAWYRHTRAKRKCAACGQVLAETLDAQALTQLQGFAVPAELKTQIVALARRMMQEQARPEHRAARVTLAKLARKLENLKELRIDGEIDRAEYARRKGEIETQIRDVQARLGDAPPDAARLEQLLPKIDQIAGVVRDGSAQRKKELYRTLFERIEQVDGRITRVIIREWARPFFKTA